MASLMVSTRVLRPLSSLLCRRGCASLTSCNSSTPSYMHPALQAQRVLMDRNVVNPFAGATYQVRSYAKKNKDKKDKGGKKKGHGHVQLSMEERQQVIDYSALLQQMTAAVETLQREYTEELSLRMNPAVFERLTVTTTDGKFPLVQLGQVTQKGADLIIINMMASPQYAKHVKDALLDSGMNLNPQQEGLAFYVPLPKITREHREKLAKNAKTLCDRAKDKLRDTQNKYLREVKKKKDEFSSDLIHDLQETIMAESEGFRSQAEKLMAAKQQELQIKK